MTDRTELRRLLDEATPGPWALYDGWLHEGRAHVARIGNAAGNGIWATAIDMEGEVADFELIAAAVNALPSLLDQLDAAEDALARVRELHCPADNDPTRTPICEGCHGKAGTHPCGCWADVDREPVCGHCNQDHKGLPVTWPCPTIRALDATQTGGES